jgi:hypothetical protein
MYTGESKSGGSWTSSPTNKRGLFVFPSHEEKWNHSKNKLLEANEENPVAKITAVGKGFHADREMMKTLSNKFLRIGDNTICNHSKQNGCKTSSGPTCPFRMVMICYSVTTGRPPQD